MPEINLVRRDDFKMYLAPWKAIQNLQCYQGMLTNEEIEKLLADEPEYTYIISDYNNAQGNQNGVFNMSVALRLNYDYGKGTTAYNRRELTFKLPQCEPQGPYRFHIVRPQKHQDDHEESYCKLTKLFKYPLKRKTPLSLKELARAEICETFKYDQITTLALEGHITTHCMRFIQEKASNVKPTRRDILFCEEYTTNRYLKYSYTQGMVPLSILKAVNAKTIAKEQYKE